MVNVWTMCISAKEISFKNISSVKTYKLHFNHSNANICLLNIIIEFVHQVETQLAVM